MSRIFSDLRARRAKARPPPAGDETVESGHAKADRGLGARLSKSLWVDSDLKKDEMAVVEASKSQFAATAQADPGIVELLREVARTEFDRETNLNTRAATVAAVAGLIVTASGAVGKTVFETTEKTLSDTERDMSVALIVVGLVALVAAMFMVVMVVLRPKQATTRQTFFTDALVGLWTKHGSSIILQAGKERLNEVAVDRLLRTIALWSVRNRQKARWLRRAWVFLALGILLIGVAGLLVVSAVLDYSLGKTLAMVAVGLALVWLVLKVDPFHAGRRESDPEKRERDDDLRRIADMLSGNASESAQQVAASGVEPGRTHGDAP